MPDNQRKEEQRGQLPVAMFPRRHCTAIREWYPELVFSQGQITPMPEKEKKSANPGGWCMTMEEMRPNLDRNCSCYATAVVRWDGILRWERAPQKVGKKVVLPILSPTQAGRRRPPLRDLTRLRKPPPAGLFSAVGEDALSVVMDRCRAAPRGGEAPFLASTSLFLMDAPLAS